MLDIMKQAEDGDGLPRGVQTRSGGVYLWRHLKVFTQLAQDQLKEYLWLFGETRDDIAEVIFT